MEHRFWNTLDNVSHFVGRSFRHGNGLIRSALACIVLVGMMLYPFYQM